MMPYITSHFMPRESGDRPYVVPEKAVNFVFLDQFASRYDIRYLLNAVTALLDGEKPELDLSKAEMAKVVKKIKGTEVEKLLKEYNII